jgi:hypothetical protein
MFEIQSLPPFDVCLNYLDTSSSSGHNASLKEMEERRLKYGLSHPHSIPITFRSIMNKLLNDFLFLAYNEVKLTLIVINN